MKKKSIIVSMSLTTVLFFNLNSAITPLSRIGSLRIYTNSPIFKDKGYDDCNIQTNGEYNTLKHIVQPGDIVFDVGANKGEWSQQVFAIESTAKIYAFEPIPDIFPALRNTLANQNATSFNIALSDTVGNKTFCYYNKNARLARLSSFYRRARDIEQRLDMKPKKITVQTDTIDSFCAKNNVPYIDILKIDTEGAELDILHGACNMLKNNNVGIIQFEYGGTYPDAGITLKQVYDLLTGYGYKIFRIVPKRLIYIPTWNDALENSLYSNWLAVAP